MAFTIEPTSRTPGVVFKEGKLTISGRSTPEDSISFFGPLFEELNSYVKNPLPITEVNLLLEYSNSSTNRVLVSIFEILRDLLRQEKTVTVNWYYLNDDKEMLDLGNDMKDISGLPFALIEVDEFPQI